MCQRQQGLITHESCFMCLSLSFITLMHKLSLQLWFVYSSTSFITRCVSDILAASPSTLFPFFFFRATFTLLSSFFSPWLLHPSFLALFSLLPIILSFYPSLSALLTLLIHSPPPQMQRWAVNSRESEEWQNIKNSYTSIIECHF